MEELSLTSLSGLELLLRQIEDSVNDSIRRRGKGLDRPHAVLDSSRDYDGAHFSKKYYDLVSLLIICSFSRWFGDFSVYLIVEVIDYVERNKLFPEISALAQVCENKYSFLYILFYYTKIKNPRKLLQTSLNQQTVDRVLDKVRLRYVKPSRPRRLIRHKGYRDHGTLREQHRWSERFDWTFNEAQRRKDEEEQLYQSTVRSIVRESGDWYLKQLALKGEESHG